MTMADYIMSAIHTIITHLFHFKKSNFKPINVFILATSIIPFYQMRKVSPKEFADLLRSLLSLLEYTA